MPPRRLEAAAFALVEASLVAVSEASPSSRYGERQDAITEGSRLRFRVGASAASEEEKKSFENEKTSRERKRYGRG